MCCSRWGRGHELYELVYVGTVLVVGTLVESALAEVATLGLKTSLKAQGDCVPDDLVKLGGAGLSAWAAEGCNEVLVPGKVPLLRPALSDCQQWQEAHAVGSPEPSFGF